MYCRRKSRFSLIQPIIASFHQQAVIPTNHLQAKYKPSTTNFKLFFSLSISLTRALTNFLQSI